MSPTRGTIQIPRKDLNLKMMLEGGQSFRWKPKGPNSWVGVFSRIVWTLEQTESTLSFTALGPKSSSEKAEKMLRNYLRLEEPLHKLYGEWASKDLNFKKAAEQCYGIRMLDQDPVENLFSFICSSNNNIIRISSMVNKMCALYGDKLCEIEGQPYYAFPEISSLSEHAVEEALRKAGFGYRAKYIQHAAKQLHENGGLSWLTTLKDKTYQEAKTALISLQGIGPKVADCICLMSLGHLDAVPVDTHVFQIACQYYLPHLKSCKSVTDRVYKEIGDFFRDLYGPLAGWAHTVLFCADLKMFKGDTNGKLENGRKRKSVSPTQNEQPDEPFLDSISGTLDCTEADLNLRVTLNCGQTYRWKKIQPNLWRGIFGNRVWTLRQDESGLEYTMNHFVVPRKPKTEKLDKEKECEALLRDYFRLDEPLHGFYEEWARRDSHFAEVSKVVHGLRMTRQDIVENLFAFICSSNNTIARITSMVESLCKLYGSKIAELGGVSFYGFPSVSSLSAVEVEKDLRGANFGFRAKYVHQAAVYIMQNGGSDWFSRLQQMSYAEAKETLMHLPGVGAKVADCICLTALNHLDTIPVDTHVFQIAKQYYLTHYKDKKSVNDKIYGEIGDHLRKVFGHYAGWAHTVLFCSDLKMHGVKKKTG